MDQVGLRNGELVTNGFMEQERSSQHLTSEEEQDEVNALYKVIVQQI